MLFIYVYIHSWYTSLYKYLFLFTFPVITPPKFNIAPERWWLEDYPFLLGLLLFRGYCLNFRGVCIPLPSDNNSGFTQIQAANMRPHHLHLVHQDPSAKCHKQWCSYLLSHPPMAPSNVVNGHPFPPDPIQIAPKKRGWGRYNIQRVAVFFPSFFTKIRGKPHVSTNTPFTTSVHQRPSKRCLVKVLNQLPNLGESSEKLTDSDGFLGGGYKPNNKKSIKNWMGPYQRTPKEVARAIRFSGWGVRSVGPVRDFLEKTELLEK